MAAASGWPIPGQNLGLLRLGWCQLYPPRDESQAALRAHPLHLVHLGVPVAVVHRAWRLLERVEHQQAIPDMDFPQAQIREAAPGIWNWACMSLSWYLLSAPMPFEALYPSSARIPFLSVLALVDVP